MKIEKLAISDAAKKLLKSEGYEKLYPPQAASVRAGILDGRSVLVSAPTASGKTLIATLAMIGHLSRSEKKIVYLSPLRALASEKYAEFKKLEGVTGAKVGVSTGDSGSSDRRLASCGIVILTNEKMDGLIRRGAGWVDEIGLVIADEAHLVGEELRGPTLEMVLTQLKLLDDPPQIVGLSATISNSDEVADWLGCKLVQSDWRPVPLAEGVCSEGRVQMSDGAEFEIRRTVCGTAVDLGLQCVNDGGQSLVFASTRPSSKSLATKAAAGVAATLKKPDAARLARLAKKILAENDNTEIIKTLAAILPKGVAFHHAGLNPACRKIVEDEFRRGTIRLLASTPTLAAGINLPARRVVISSVLRYDARYGRNMPISVLEYKQFCGRAGRPQYDKLGEAIIVDDRGGGQAYEHYVEGEPEPIESHMSSEKSLRIHALAAIVSHPAIAEKELLDFFLETFAGFKYYKTEIKHDLESALEFLKDNGLVISKGPKKRYAATEFGKKSSTLYMDPVTSVRFRDALAKVQPGNHNLGYLHLIAESEEFYPKFSLRQKDYEFAGKILDEHESEMLKYFGIEGCSRSAVALYCWMSEYTDLQLSERIGVEPGDMHRMRETGAWLAFCLREMAAISKNARILGDLDVLRKRISNGVKKELIPLVGVRGIGRVRARRLYRGGIRDLEALGKVTPKRLASIGGIGPVLAAGIKAELKKAR